MKDVWKLELAYQYYTPVAQKLLRIHGTPCHPKRCEVSTLGVAYSGTAALCQLTESPLETAALARLAECIKVMPVYTSNHGGAILDISLKFNHNLQALDGNSKGQQLGNALNILQEAAEQKILPFLQLV